MGQHCTGQNPMQCCPGGSRQHCKKKKKSCAILPWHSSDNIAQVKTLCNVARKAPDNIA